MVLYEEDELVRLALAPHFATFAASDPSYEELVSAYVMKDGELDLTTKVIIATAERVRPTQHVVRLLAERERRLSARRQTIVNIRGGIVMSDDRKTVTNITHGGSISVGSINLGEIENSSLEILSRIDVTSPTDAELRLTLERFVGAIATDVEVSQEDKAVLHAVVQDVATYQHEPPEKRRTLLQKSVAALKGLTVTLPAAAKFATEARALIDAIARVLTP